MDKTDVIKLLAIDDKPDNLTTLSAVVQDALPRTLVLTATNGPAGIELAAAEDPDVILLDIVMPGMDGFEVCRRLKADERSKDIPVVFLTALKTDTASRVKALEAGGEGFLAKPLEINELIAQIRAMTKVKAANRSQRMEKERLEALVEERMLKLRESELRHRAMFENMAAASCVDEIVYEHGRAVDYRILDVNPAYERITGIRSQDAIGALASALYGRGQAPFLDVYGRVAETGEPAEFEVWFEHLQKHLHITAGSPKRGFFSTVFTDITERKQAEEKISEQLQELQKVTMAIEQAGEMVMITDSQGTIQYVNPAFTAVTGYSREEAIGQSPRLLKSGKQDREFYQVIWATLRDGRTFHGRMVNKRKDGTLYTEEATLSPVKDVSGRILNYVAVKRDVTELLRTEEERVKLEGQFHQAQKMEYIGRLAGGVAHDFNNMLGIILGYSEMVFDKLNPNDPLRKDIHNILEAGRRSAALTRQLLAFSRKQTLKPVALDLNQLIRDLEKMLPRLIGEDIQLELALGENISRVLVDPGQIDQVLMNLVVNARDAMPRGGKLLIETSDIELDDTSTKEHPGSKAGKYVMLAVTDTGCGMSREILDQIFDPFFTTKEKDKGTGLGLSTVYGIVKQSGGNIWVYSEPGQGTTFKMYFPKTEADQESAMTKPEVAAPVTGGEHILVVEDEGSLRKLMARLLERLGYHVTLAAGGDEALLLIEEKGQKFDLVITDVIMPNMSGKELTDRLWRNQPDLKILYMSGYTDDAIVHHGVLNPGTPFIQKPFTEQTLSVKIRELLGG